MNGSTIISLITAFPTLYQSTEAKADEKLVEGINAAVAVAACGIYPEGAKIGLKDKKGLKFKVYRNTQTQGLKRRYDNVSKEDLVPVFYGLYNFCVTWQPRKCKKNEDLAKDIQKLYEFVIQGLEALYKTYQSENIYAHALEDLKNKFKEISSLKCSNESHKQKKDKAQSSKNEISDEDINLEFSFLNTKEARRAYRIKFEDYVDEKRLHNIVTSLELAKDETMQKRNPDNDIKSALYQTYTFQAKLLEDFS
ncbi:MAG: hypothetical protein Tsb0021_01980 [Chlamydiales bacterium]